MKTVRRTLRDVFKTKYGLLLFIGMLAGLAAAWYGSTQIPSKNLSTMVTMVGAIVCLVCGNGFASMITIVMRRKEEE